ncbi:MAG: hypothetical protein GF370_04780 [Candidatus Nealsonbacteria bacterium]|nr:hypothetical protein [Candidatus Nealsonbacteria bacterium]
MEQNITKEEAEELMNIKGKTRGMAIKDDFEYVLMKKGQEGVKKIEEELKRLGYPFKCQSIKAMKLYPSGLEPLIMLICQRMLQYTEEDFKELGRISARMPLVIRVFVKYLGSLEMIVKGASSIWQRYYSQGDFEVTEVNEEKCFVVVRIKDFALHPLYCKGLEGYFEAMVKLVVKKDTQCEETKCIHRGDKFHEFLIKW